MPVYKSIVVRVNIGVVGVEQGPAMKAIVRYNGCSLCLV